MARPAIYGKRIQRHVRLTPELNDAAERKAEDSGISFNRWVEMAVTQFIGAPVVVKRTGLDQTFGR